MNKEREHISRVRGKKTFFELFPSGPVLKHKLTLSHPHIVPQDGDASLFFFLKQHCCPPESRSSLCMHDMDRAGQTSL